MENNFAEGYAIGRDSNSNNNGWGFGNNGDLLWIIVLFALLGWGNNGNGFGGGFGGNNMNYEIGRLATTNDVASGFSTSTIMSTQRDTQLALTQGFAGLNTAIANATSTLGYNMAQGFHGVDNAICSLGYNIQNGFNGLSHQLSDCCCQTQRAIDGVNYNMAKNTCDIIQANNNNTQRVIDFLTNEKIASLQAENSGLKAQISNDRQSAYLLNELKPCPIPAYLTCNPNAPYGLGYGVGFGVNTSNSNCGC